MHHFSWFDLKIISNLLITNRENDSKTAILGRLRSHRNPICIKKACQLNSVIKFHHYASFFMVLYENYGYKWKKKGKMAIFEPKNWSHIFLEAGLAKILMDYVLLTLPASLANFFHGLIWKSLA